MQIQEEAEPGDVTDAIFAIAEWPVRTPAAKEALTAITNSHYILTPPIYDLPGQLVQPTDYYKRFRGATALVGFRVTCYKWDKNNTICADLEHLRVLVTPSPLTPVTPRRKRPLKVDRKFTITQPDFKKAKLESTVEGTIFPVHLEGPELIPFTQDDDE